MKNRKLKLDDLKVKSFVTDLVNDDKMGLDGTNRILGGSLQVSCFDKCVSEKNGICLPPIDLTTGPPAFTENPFMCPEH